MVVSGEISDLCVQYTVHVALNMPTVGRRRTRVGMQEDDTANVGFNAVLYWRKPGGAAELTHRV